MFEIEQCTKHCLTVNPSADCMIVMFSNDRINGIQYCCNSIKNNPNVSDPLPACWYGSKFGMEQGAMMPGVAALQDLVTANNTNTTRTNTTGAFSDCPECEETNDVAIGVGIGVPLGVMVLTAVAWALWERRKRVNAVVPLAQVSPTPEYPPPAQKPAPQPNELMGHPDVVELESDYRNRHTGYNL
ncbi:uncharacterized protein DSM5745_08613 [Aspergillus mulundensis]|uniref:Uncharacterized protein n=1 Tax=Aspergillus mulundensis TaxID=1810919 RepID=A0A3D8R464_9EURO|nr:hypothetical protein DSM5745_08613 [Aspergillus mulundensis]RDW68853.1 hypothetical protein DSM5745_08613 [Aspergillus mulundensis]